MSIKIFYAVPGKMAGSQKIEPAILRCGSDPLENNRPLLHLAIAGRVVLMKILNALNKYV